MEETTKKGKKADKPFRKYLVMAVVVVAVLAGGYFGWMKYQAMQNTPEAVAKKQEDKKQRLLALTAKIMVVPQEEATMLEVNNADQLKTQQAFFKDVQNGDVLFIFPKAMKAIIYRENGNMVVNSGPLQTEQPAANTPAPTPAPSTKK